MSLMHIMFSLLPVYFQIELEVLNQAASDINRLEREIDVSVSKCYEITRLQLQKSSYV